LPELALIEGNQQVATNPDETLSPSLFTFRSHLASIHRYYYYDFMTARRARLPWSHRTRLGQLLLLFITANVSSKLENPLFAQSYPEQYENVGFVHSWCTVEPPSSTNCLAVAKPIPLLPPVINAIFPPSLPIELLLTSFSVA